VVHRYVRESKIGVCDVNVRGGRLRVIGKDWDWGGGGGSDGDNGYTTVQLYSCRERTIINCTVVARSCERDGLKATSYISEKSFSPSLPLSFSLISSQTYIMIIHVGFTFIIALATATPSLPSNSLQPPSNFNPLSSTPSSPRALTAANGCQSVSITGCDQQSAVFMGSYTLTPDLCNDRTTYLSPTNTFSIVYSSDIKMWTVAASCDSSVVRVQGGTGHEPFFPGPNDYHQCFVNDGGKKMVNRTVTFECEEAVCGEGEVLSTDPESETPCQPCPEGVSASPDALMCGTCSAGSERSGLECQPCVKGFFSDTDSLEPCEPCAQSTYSDEEGAAKCRACPVGHVTPVGSTAVGDCIEDVVCEPGYFEIENSADPCACDLDGVVNGIDTGKATCKSHTSGFDPSCYVRPECTSATASGSFPGTKFRDCDPLLDNLGACSACPPGSFTSASGSLACIPCQAGSYSTSNSSSSCTLCPASTYGIEAGATACSPCAYNTTAGSTTCPILPINDYHDMKTNIGNGGASETAAAALGAETFVIRGGASYKMLGNATAPRTDEFHDFDFRGCNGTVQDKHTWRKGYPINNATCTASGMQFDGTDQYIDLDDFYFGSTTTIEMYAKHDSYKFESNLFKATAAGEAHLSLRTRVLHRISKFT